MAEIPILKIKIGKIIQKTKATNAKKSRKAYNIINNNIAENLTENPKIDNTINLI